MIQQPLPLIYHEQPNPPPRPGRFDRKVLEVAALSLLPEVLQWLKHAEPPNHVFSEFERSEITEQLTEILDSSFELDGFKLARRLENQGWECDSELVEILDCAVSHVTDAHESAVKAWTAANVVTAKLAVGDEVRTPHGNGAIAEVRRETAEYLVQTVAYLLRYPHQRGKSGGIVVPFENCELVNSGS